MSYSDISPFSVVAYDKSHIVELIRYKTGWNQRGEVYSKAQINYIDQYLKNKSTFAETLVIEYEYIDRHYLEDYSEYYARCFPSHPRTCARAHFFSHKFEEEDLLNALRSENSEFTKQLQENYIGFAVLRPIPKTCIAKLCLKAYTNENDVDSDYKIITKRVDTNLFGIKLSVESAPFLEQDKVVSACATSAIWTFLSASKDRPSDANPSPSAITKSAFDQNTDGVRTFPNTGLSAVQVCRSLKYFDFEPTLFYKNNEKGGAKVFLDELKEYVFSHISAGVPVILGGDVFDCTTDGVEPRHLGKHLVCVLGFKATPKSSDKKIYAHSIDKLYVHDDRYGPYVRLESLARIRREKDDSEGFRSWLRSIIRIIRKKQDAPKDGFQLAIINDRNLIKREIFVPDVAIVGLYHKIRISYPTVFDMHHSFLAYLKTSIANIDNLWSHFEPSRKQYYSKIKSAISEYTNGSCQIALTTNSEYKNEILKSVDFVSFNGVLDKVFFLTASLPKYIWRCRTLVDGNIHSDILIDATEILQGKIILGTVSYCRNAEVLYKYIEKSNGAHEWERTGSESERELIGGYISFFQRGSGESKLNSIYGPLKLPKRKLKPGEFDDINNITPRSDISIIVGAEKSPFWDSLEKYKLTHNPASIKHKKYIWVINGDGHLVVGEDIEDENDKEGNTKYLGHPTLISGMPARLGGEFVFINGNWFVNLKSRAYPSGHKPQSKEWHAILDRVIKYNINGLSIEKELPI